MTNLFTINHVANIVEGTKPFYGIQFSAGTKLMTLSYTERYGSKLFWKFDDKIKQTTKNEVLVWLKKWQGADAKKLAGYIKLMQPISRGPVVSHCECCGRGIDEKVVAYSTNHHNGSHLCMPCQKNRGPKQSATNGSAKRNTKKIAYMSNGSIAGVPIFKLSELREAKPVKLNALYAQIVKVLPKHVNDVELTAKLQNYASNIESILAAQAMQMDEASQEQADQREASVPATDGVKEVSESNKEALADAVHSCGRYNLCDERNKVSQVGAYCKTCAEVAAYAEEARRQDDAAALANGDYDVLTKSQLRAELSRRGQEISNTTYRKTRKAGLIALLIELDEELAKASVEQPAGEVVVGACPF